MRILILLLLTACSPTKITIDQRGAKDSRVEVNTETQSSLRDERGIDLSGRKEPDAKED